MKKIYSIILLLFLSQQLLCQTIQMTGQMTYSRTNHQSQVLNNGKVLAFGGEAELLSTIVRQSCELYDPNSGTWSTQDFMNSPRTRFGSMLLPNGNVFVFGGDTTGNSDYTATCEIYDVTSNSWTYTESMHNAKGEFAFAILNDGRLLVAAGISSTEVAEIYDPVSGHWSVVSSTFYNHGDASFMLALSNNKVLLAAGLGVSSSQTAEIYDVTSDQWNPLPDMNYNHEYGSAILLNNGKALIAGGSGTEAELFDPSTNTFSATASSNQIRRHCPMVLLNNSNPIAFGEGDIFNPSNTQCLEWYDVVSAQWMSQIYNIGGTQNYTIHKILSDKILIIGGEFLFDASPYVYLVTDNTVGISEMLSDKFKIYPNPVNDKLFFDLSNIHSTDLKVTFYNILGKEVASHRLNNSNPSLDISSFNKGVYQYILDTNNELIYAGKIIKN